jgi:putative PEP-CTERM system histidine kinase
MNSDFSIFSHGAGALAFGLLSIYILQRYLRRNIDRSLFVACAFSTIWLLILCLQSVGHEIDVFVRYCFEILRNAAWVGVLYSLLGLGLIPTRKQGPRRFYASAGILVLFSLSLLLTFYHGIMGMLPVSSHSYLILMVATSLVGLLLLEQIWRNSSLYSRSGAQYLKIAIAALFGYDFLLYSDALMFQQISDAIWEARGAINALAAPLIMLTLVNSRKQPIGIHISRQMVFHTTTFILAGVYLLVVSAGGYYISFFGGTWGEALRVLFIFAGLMVLVVLISSPVLRAKVMVFVSKNFFDYKYDYRDEWIKSTQAFANASQGDSLHTQIVRVLGALVGSQRGALWVVDDEGNFALRGKLQLDEQRFDPIDGNSELVDFFHRQEWIVNLDEYILDPAKYNLIEIPDDILKQEHPWLILPLRMNTRVMGIALLSDPIAPIDLNWENYDLLRIVSTQAASYLAQNYSQERLAEARQFEAVNKTSAFLVHDIKTIIAQLSLLVKNSERHKGNPAFIDDMISTTRHTVEKMDHLLQQIRNPSQELTQEEVCLNEVLREVEAMHRNAAPRPKFSLPDVAILIRADRAQIKSAIDHIVQNALDATSKDGEVSVTTKTAPGFVYIFVQDSGVGMSEEFIEKSLFKPFESTKGLTGMGIGVYQSRDYLKRLGGSISVTSELQVGTCFTLKIPTLTKTD